MKTSDWISVNDKLPELNERVLVCRKLEDGSTYVDFAMRGIKAEYLSNIDKYITKEIWNIENVTHWQKLVLPNEQKLKDVSERENHIEHMLSDDWEGDEEIFLTEDECSKPFNTPKILGCVDNLNDIIK